MSNGAAAAAIAKAAAIAIGLKFRTRFNPLNDRDPRMRSRLLRISPAQNFERSY